MGYHAIKKIQNIMYFNVYLTTTQTTVYMLTGEMNMSTMSSPIVVNRMKEDVKKFSLSYLRRQVLTMNFGLNLKYIY